MAWSVSGSKTKARTRVRALLNSVKVKPTEVLFSQVLYGIACIDCIDIACIDSFDIASLDCIDIASVDCIDMLC